MISEIKIKLKPKDTGMVHHKIHLLFEWVKMDELAYLKIFNFVVYAKMGEKIALFGKEIR